MATERRLIDANELEMHKFPTQESLYDYGWNDAIDAITENAPTVDAVEVVRCKDCVHYKPQFQGVHRNCTTPYCMRKVAVKVEPDDFCSYGERRPDV